MVKRKNLILAIFAAVGLGLALLAALLGGRLTEYAESPVSGTDGVYSVPVNLSALTMGADNFSSQATVEKEGDNYYMTFGHSSSISDMALQSGSLQAGSTVKRENGWTFYTYTLNAQRLQGSLSFSAYINAMGMNVNFTISLDLSSGTRTGNYTYEGERPAESLPRPQYLAAKNWT